MESSMKIDNNMNPTLFAFYIIKDGIVDSSKNLGINDIQIFDETKKRHILNPDISVCCKVCYDILSQNNEIIGSHRHGNIYFKHHNSTCFCTLKSIDSTYDVSEFFNKSGVEFYNFTSQYFDSNNKFEYQYKSDCCITNPKNIILTIRDKSTIQIFDSHIIFDNVFLSFNEKIDCISDMYIHLYCTKDSFIKYLIKWKTAKSYLECKYIHHNRNRVCEKCQNDKQEYLSELEPKIKQLIDKKYLNYLPPCKIESVIGIMSYVSIHNIRTYKNDRLSHQTKIITYECDDDYMFMNSKIVKCIAERMTEDGFNISIDNVQYSYQDIVESINNFNQDISFDETKLRSCLNNMLEILFVFNFIHKFEYKYNFNNQYILYKLKTGIDEKFYKKIINNYKYDYKYNFRYNTSVYKNHERQIKIRNEIIEDFKKDWKLYNTIVEYVEIPAPTPKPTPIPAPITAPIPAPKPTPKPRPFLQQNNRPVSPILPAPPEPKPKPLIKLSYIQYENKIYQQLNNKALHYVSDFKRIKLFVLLNDSCYNNKYPYTKFHDEIQKIRNNNKINYHIIVEMVEYFAIQRTNKVIKLLDENEIDINNVSVDEIHRSLNRIVLEV